MAASAQQNLALAQAQEMAMLGSVAGPAGANLFVYHIPNSWDDNILRQHFEHFGPIISCKVQRDPDGRPRGFGFVSYKDPTSANAAIAGMHGFPVDGKHLKVQLKKGDSDLPMIPVPPPPGGAAPPPPGSFAPAAPARPPPPPGSSPY